MTNSTPWIIPILLLPGVALLILSTATRYGQIHSELHHLLDIDEAVTADFWQHLNRRSILFRNALVSLYFSVGAFVMGSLVGALVEMTGRTSTVTVTAFAFVGILCLIFAAYELILESRSSFLIITHHLSSLKIIEER